MVCGVITKSIYFLKRSLPAWELDPTPKEELDGRVGRVGEWELRCSSGENGVQKSMRLKDGRTRVWDMWVRYGRERLVS